MEIEYNQYKLTIYIYTNLIKNLCIKKKCEYEIHNILERFFLCVNNLKKDNTWSTIFTNVSFRHACVKQLLKEFYEKRKKYLKRSLNKEIIKNIILEIILKKINLFIKKKKPIDRKKTVIKYNGNYIIFRDIKVEVNPKILIELKKYKRKYVAKMVCRYSAMLIRSQQWGIPLEQYDYLYKKYGIKYEGFASPLNSRMIRYKDGYFCSLFYDTDKYFGSLGDFFEVDMLEKNNIGWTINPPYIEDLMLKSAQKCIKTINKAKKRKKKILIFYIMPGWFDAKTYKLLHNFKHTKYEEILKPNQHFYEDISGKKIISIFNSIVFILDSYNYNINYSNINKKMKI